MFRIINSIYSIVNGLVDRVVLDETHQKLLLTIDGLIVRVVHDLLRCAMLIHVVIVRVVTTLDKIVDVDE